MTCPDCKSGQLQPCGFDIGTGKVAIAYYVCLQCYCAFKSPFLDSDEEDIL